MPDEISLRDYIDIRITNVEDKLDAQAKFNAQHFQLNELAIQKAEDSMISKLEGMNEFRSRIEKLEAAAAFLSGKLWMVAAIFAAVPTIIALVAFFRSL